MTYNQIVGHYRGLSKAAKALEMSKQRINAWKRIRIPSDIQLEIAARTRGRLKADRQAIRTALRISAYVQEANGG